MVWGKAGSTTLTSAGDTIDVTGLTGNTFYMGLLHYISSSYARDTYRFNSDSGSNYANRKSDNGGADTTYVSHTFMIMQSRASSDTAFTVFYGVNIAGEEKLVIADEVYQNTAGAGNAPNRDEGVGKWANTSDAINSIQAFNDQTGDYNTDSNLSVLGSDLTPASAVPAKILDGLIFEETDTNKHYIYTASTDTWTEI